MMQHSRTCSMARPLPRLASNAARRCSPSLTAHTRAQALSEVSPEVSSSTAVAVCTAAIRRVAPFALAVALSLPTGVQAADQVGNFGASGFIFKDSVEVVAVEDPDVKGVVIYVSDFKRSLPDKLAKNFFAEPSQASVTCATTGPVSIANKDRIKGSGGYEVFSEAKGLNLFQNKTLRVKRIYDEKRDTLLYIAYSTRLSSAADDGVSSGRYRTSICALPVSPAVSQAAATAEEQIGAPPTAAVR